MKHVVFVVGSYYPFFSAVGNCAEKVISILKNEYDISVVSIKDDPSLNTQEEFDGYNIYRVENSYQKRLNHLNLKNNSHSLITKIKLFKERLLNLITFVLRSKSVDPDLINVYSSQLNTLNEQQKIDVVIPFVFPFESVLAAIKFKDKAGSECVILPYLFDNFSKSASLHRFNINRKIKYSQNQRLEQLMLEHAIKVFAMHPLKNHFDSTVTELEQAKILYVEHPLLLNRKLTASREGISEVINFTYTGGLFRGVRTANSCLNLLDMLSEVTPINVNFYCFGNDLTAINKYAESKPNAFHNYGKVPREQAEQAVADADILINIGDVEGKQLSSKIFDYLSMGKPIIHFAYVENCVNSLLLKKYPLAHIVVQPTNNQYSKQVISEVVTFTKKTKGKVMTFSEVAKVYPEALPATTASLFKHYIG